MPKSKATIDKIARKKGLSFSGISGIVTGVSVDDMGFHMNKVIYKKCGN